MNKSYYINSTENITSTNHSAGLQIVMNVSVLETTYITVHVAVTKEPTTTIILTTLLWLIKIMTIIWQKKIK